MMSTNKSKNIYHCTEFNKGKLTVVFIVSVLLLFFLHNSFSNNFFAFVAIGLLVLSVMVLDCKELLLIAIALAPNIAMVKFISMPYAIHSYYLILIELRYFLIEKKGNFFLPISNILVLLCALITLSLRGDVDIVVSSIRTILLLLMLYNHIRENTSSYYKKRVVNYYIYGAVANVLMGIAYYSIKSMNIFSGYFAGIRNDRNYFSTILAIAISLSILYLPKYSVKTLIGKIICVSILIVGGMLSQSRTFLIALVWVVILVGSFIFNTFLLNKYKKRNIILCTFILVALMAFNYEMIQSLFDSLLARFTDDTAQGGNGRLELWQGYLSLMFSSLDRTLFGNGSALQYVQNGMFIYIEHNTFVQMISSAGIVGSICILFSYYGVYRDILKNHNFFKKFTSYIPLLVTLTGYFNISAFYLAHFDLSVFVCIMAVPLFNEVEE